MPNPIDPDATADRDATLVLDAAATAADLHRIAAERPDLRAAVASHPAAYPDLLTWLGTCHDPAVDAALAARPQPVASVASAGIAAVRPDVAANTRGSEGIGREPVVPTAADSAAQLVGERRVSSQKPIAVAATTVTAAAETANGDFSATVIAPSWAEARAKHSTVVPVVRRGEDPTAKLAANPAATAEELHKVVSDRPDLRATVAANPAAYPDLLAWLGTLGEPQIDAALAARAAANGAGTTAGTGTGATVRTSIGMAAGAAAGTAVAGQTVRTSIFGAAATNATPVTGATGSAAPVGVTAATGYQAASSYGTQQPAAQSPQQNMPPVVSVPAAGYPAATPTASAKLKGHGGTIVLISLLLVTIAVLIAAILFLWRPWAGPGPAKPASPAPAATAPAAGAQPSVSPSPTPSTSGVLAPPGSVRLSEFTTPSGNISCKTTGERSFVCTIQEHTITTADSSGIDCDGPITFSWEESSRMRTICEATVQPGQTKLAYGSSAILSDGIACTSAESGIECWDTKNGSGFQLARRGVSPVKKP